MHKFLLIFNEFFCSQIMGKNKIYKRKGLEDMLVTLFQKISCLHLYKFQKNNLYAGFKMKTNMAFY